MKIPKKVWFILSAGLGGTALTWIDVATNPSNVDHYVFLGMLGAAVIGIIAYLLVGDTTIKSAITTGIAGPNILGGIVKTGTVIVTFLEIGTFSIFPVAFADNGIDKPAVEDTAQIEISVQGTEEEVIIKDMKTNQIYVADYNSPAQVPFSDSLEITVNGLGKQIIEVDKDYIVDSTKKLNVIVIQKKRSFNFLRGIFPMQQKHHDPLTKKFKVKEVKQMPPEPVEEAKESEIDTTEKDITKDK